MTNLPFADVSVESVIGGVVAASMTVGTGMAAGLAWVLKYLRDRADDQQKYLDSVFTRFESVTDRHNTTVALIHKECADERKDGAKVIAALAGSVTKLSNQLKTGIRVQEPADNS